MDDTGISEAVSARGRGGGSSCDGWGNTKKARILELVESGAKELTARDAAERCGMSRSHARQTLMGLVAERVMHVARRLTVESRSGKTVPGEIVFGLGEGPGSLHGGTGNDLLDAILGRLAKSGQDLAEDGPHGEAGARREALRGQMALMGALYGGNWKRGSQENLGVTEMQT